MRRSREKLMEQEPCGKTNQLIQALRNRERRKRSKKEEKGQIESEGETRDFKDN